MCQQFSIDMEMSIENCNGDIINAVESVLQGAFGSGNVTRYQCHDETNHVKFRMANQCEAALVQASVTFKVWCIIFPQFWSPLVEKSFNWPFLARFSRLWTASEGYISMIHT